MCTLIDVNEVGDDEQGSTLLPGVRGREAIRRRPHGVEGRGVLRWMRIVEPGVLGTPGALSGRPLLGVMSTPGVLGGSRLQGLGLGLGLGSGVVGHDMVDVSADALSVEGGRELRLERPR